MCGRTAQTYHAASSAARSLNAPPPPPPADGGDDNDDEGRDNFNLSPGMDATVIWCDGNGKLCSGRKVWGLVSRGGSKTSPLPTGMSQHFSNLMFNARADTLYQKTTFARLANAGKTCVIAVDGYFEWKSEGPGKGSKQPYFVKPGSNKSYLLMAGLWTSVATGRGDTLDTFTMITTEACPPIQWLHSRMPVCIWDEALALDWIRKPSEPLHSQLEEASRKTREGLLDWHAVTKDMVSMKFRSADAIKALPKMKTVKSFFSSAAPKGTQKSPPASKKRPLEASSSASPPLQTSKGSSAQTAKSATAPPSPSQPSSVKKAKKKNKGPLDSFFTRKKVA